MHKDSNLGPLGSKPRTLPTELHTEIYVGWRPDSSPLVCSPFDTPGDGRNPLCKGSAKYVGPSKHFSFRFYPSMPTETIVESRRIVQFPDIFTAWPSGLAGPIFIATLMEGWQCARRLHRSALAFSRFTARFHERPLEMFLEASRQPCHWKSRVTSAGVAPMLGNLPHSSVELGVQAAVVALTATRGDGQTTCMLRIPVPIPGCLPSPRVPRGPPWLTESPSGRLSVDDGTRTRNLWVLPQRPIQPRLHLQPTYPKAPLTRVMRQLSATGCCIAGQGARFAATAANRWVNVQQNVVCANK